MKAADTRLMIAAFASSHEAARRALDGGPHLIEHCALETYSVLSRLPSPHRSPGQVVRDFFAARFPQPWLRLSERAYKDYILGLADRGVTGGAAYDALVAATAAGCGAELVSCDRRALTIYERYGVRTQFLP